MPASAHMLQPHLIDIVQVIALVAVTVRVLLGLRSVQSCWLNRTSKPLGEPSQHRNTPVEVHASSWNPSPIMQIASSRQAAKLLACTPVVKRLGVRGAVVDRASNQALERVKCRNFIKARFWDLT